MTKQHKLVGKRVRCVSYGDYKDDNIHPVSAVGTVDSVNLDVTLLRVFFDNDTSCMKDTGWLVDPEELKYLNNKPVRL